MQRRLTIALVLTAVMSILLVAVGVLAMAQFSARSDAEAQVDSGLQIVARFLDDDQGQTTGRLDLVLDESRQDFGLDVLGVGIINVDGQLLSLAERRRAIPLTEELPAFELDSSQLAALEGQEVVFIPSDDSVVGVRQVNLDRLANAIGDENQVVVVASRRVSAVSGRTLVWFLGSSGLVLAGAALAGMWLAKRLVNPLRDIQATTTAIAGGDLTARVATAGSDEVAELGQAVNGMASDLQRSKALDRQFLMSVSHDLRTPLTAISGYAEALQDGALDDPQSAGAVIGNHADRLDRLVGDLLDLAKLDANRFRFDLRPFDLAVTAGRTVAGLTRRAAEHNLILTSSGVATLPVVADPDRTAQAVGNLIDNAIKFARTTVVVDVQPVVTGQSRWAVVSVHDDGPGIPEADLPHIFDRLYTGSAQPDRAENPTGLGLAIVRELAGAMGGHVRAGNAPTGGAVLSIALPTGADGSGPMQEPPTSTWESNAGAPAPTTPATAPPTPEVAVPTAP